jgi:hypothetical protein
VREREAPLPPGTHELVDLARAAAAERAASHPQPAAVRARAHATASRASRRRQKRGQRPRGREAGRAQAQGHADDRGGKCEGGGGGLASTAERGEADDTTKTPPPAAAAATPGRARGGSGSGRPRSRQGSRTQGHHPNLYWRAVSHRELRCAHSHPCFWGLPHPSRLRFASRAPETWAQLRQESELWSRLHRGVLTSRNLPGYLGEHNGRRPAQLTTSPRSTDNSAGQGCWSRGRRRCWGRPATWPAMAPCCERSRSSERLTPGAVPRRHRWRRGGRMAAAAAAAAVTGSVRRRCRR